MTPWITDILNSIYELYKAGINISFLWIPGHKGIMGNKKDDFIAKESLKRDVIDNNYIWFEEIFGRFKKVVKIQMTNYIKGYNFSRGRKN